MTNKYVQVKCQVCGFAIPQLWLPKDEAETKSYLHTYCRIHRDSLEVGISRIKEGAALAMFATKLSEERLDVSAEKVERVVTMASELIEEGMTTYIGTLSTVFYQSTYDDDKMIDHYSTMILVKPTGLFTAIASLKVMYKKSHIDECKRIDNEAELQGYAG